jgi:hypothetical protein
MLEFGWLRGKAVKVRDCSVCRDQGRASRTWREVVEPIGLIADDLDELRAFCRSALQLGHQLRYVPAVSDETGRVGSARVGQKLVRITTFRIGEIARADREPGFADRRELRFRYLDAQTLTEYRSAARKPQSSRELDRRRRHRRFGEQDQR